jgi:hypothetical protein
MYTSIRSLRGFVSLAAIVAVVSLANDAPGVAQAPTSQLQVTPQDTSLNLNATNYSAQPLLTAYTWPDNQMANAIVMKFDLSALPAGATVEEGVLNLALVESDATADATYTMTAHKQVGMNPVIAAATGYTADGVTPWTPSACCYNGVPLAQSDISAPYAVLAVDKTPGVKMWAITTMVREWVASPASNFGLVLNADATKARDRYRYFASTKHADATLWPVLQITYSMPTGDTTPPVISAVVSSSITKSGATISWSTNEASDSQIEYGLTAAYGSSTSVNTTQVTAHSLPLSGLLEASVYNYRVRSRDAAGNLAVSGNFSFKTLDQTLPSVSISAPAAGATVSGVVAISALASDNVGVASVQFRVDGVAFGARDTASPWTISWNTATATAGSHALSAVARDAAGNATTSAAVTVTVNNTDAIVPTVAMTAPANGATVTGSAVTASANAADNIGVVGVQFKLDGAVLGAEDTTSPYSTAWNTTTTANGSHTVTAVARDAAGNTATSAAVTVTVSNATTVSTTIWNASATPIRIATNDPAAVELGVRFRADINGSITGVRFYKGASNTGTHTGSLWTNTGTRLATATFSNETASGWQQVTFSSPVAVTANTTYVASYHTNVGQYAVNRPFFATAGVDNPPLHALADGVGGVNGVFVYGASAFPTGTWQSSNYWVDVAFSGSGVPDTTPPTVAMTAPANGATVSGSAVAVSATASDNVQVGGVQFKLDGVNLGAEDTASPFSTAWNTTGASGTHTLAAVARDAAGNTATATAVTVTIASDTTAPVISSVSATSNSTTSETMGWTTNEGSDSQVDYGPTTAYGSSSTLNAASVTAHSVLLSSLSPSTTYHARVRSRDAAGNLAMSGDVAFTTPATPPPPPPPPTSGWPHEPAGFAAWASSTLDLFSGNGWNIVNPSGYATIMTDAGGSMTPAKVGQWRYP